MAAINKLRHLDRTSAGITIPRDDLELEGVVDPDAVDLRLVSQPLFVVNRVADGLLVVDRTDVDTPDVRLDWSRFDHGQTTRD